MFIPSFFNISFILSSNEKNDQAALRIWGHQFFPPGLYAFLVYILNSRILYIAIGIQMDGIRDVLSMWVGENESAKYNAPDQT